MNAPERQLAPALAGSAVTVISSEQVADSTLAVRLTRPAGFTFKAGQNVELVLPRIAQAPPGAERRTLSIASAPCDRELLLAMRLRGSPFKLAMGALVRGDPARIEGPYGSLVMHRAPRRDAVMIAGGIGITPFLSMLRQAAHDRDPRHFTLVYSNRRPSSAAFLAELQRLEKDYSGFRLVATMTGMSDADGHWDGERRTVDAGLVQIAAQASSQPVFYVAGPPSMVTAVRAALEQAGVDDDDVRCEEFFGY